MSHDQYPFLVFWPPLHYRQWEQIYSDLRLKQEDSRYQNWRPGISSDLASCLFIVE